MPAVPAQAWPVCCGPCHQLCACRSVKQYAHVNTCSMHRRNVLHFGLFGPSRHHMVTSGSRAQARTTAKSYSPWTDQSLCQSAVTSRSTHVTEMVCGPDKGAYSGPLVHAAKGLHLKPLSAPIQQHMDCMHANTLADCPIRQNVLHWHACHALSAHTQPICAHFQDEGICSPIGKKIEVMQHGPSCSMQA